MILVRISGGVFSSGALGPPQLTAQYLKYAQYHQVLLLLNQLDWATQGQVILTCLNTMFNKLLRVHPFNRETESLMEMCLGLFYAPNKPIGEDVSRKIT